MFRGYVSFRECTMSLRLLSFLQKRRALSSTCLHASARRSHQQLGGNCWVNSHPAFTTFFHRQTSDKLQMKWFQQGWTVWKIYQKYVINLQSLCNLHSFHNCQDETTHESHGFYFCLFCIPGVSKHKRRGSICCGWKVKRSTAVWAFSTSD